MKLHLRAVRLGQVTYRLVSPRPGADVVFSTNYYHDTWHLITNQRGSHLLARLLWGLSFQRRPGTAVVIHGEQIKSTPFGAEPSDPILLLTDRVPTSGRTLRQLHRNLKRLGPPHCTVRWHTFGLDRALECASLDPVPDLTREDHLHDPLYHRDNERLWKSEQMFRRGGFVCYSAPPAILRHRALLIAKMDPGTDGMDYQYLADNNAGYWPDGEVQIFSDYQDRRSAAAEARRQILAQGRLFGDPEALYAVVAEYRDAILRERRWARFKRGRGPDRARVRPQGNGR